MKRFEVILFGYLFMLFFANAHEVMAQKTDTVYHTNSNVLTGEFKKLSYGVLSWSMSGMGTITFETPEINKIKSDKLFEIKLNNGTLYFGSFDTTGVDRQIKVILKNGSKISNMDDIVEVYPLKNSFWLRTIGNFSLGFNFSKGSNVISVASSGNLTYRKKNRLTRLNGTTTIPIRQTL